MTPRATVRLQFNRDFTLDDAVGQVPYFRALGISHIYASPLLAARAGSTHGYDVIDPAEINAELGGYPALLKLSRALERQGMGLILDIVPNHMAADAANAWWWDVLLWGPASRYAGFFDIDWQDPDPELTGKVLLPVLGDTLEACIDRGELTLDTDQDGLFICRYFDQRFPVDPRCCAGIFDIGEPGWSALLQQARLLESIPPGDKFELAAARLSADFADRLRVARPGELQKLLAPYHARSGATRLRALLERQNYVLAPWREAATRINWRRFFDINGLVALRMDRAEVFDAYHRMILQLVRDGIVDGVRVDHVDGLADPVEYCRRLRAALDPVRPDRTTYLVLEKILDRDEMLDTGWPVQGTTGYDFMDQVSAVLHDAEGEPALTALWEAVSGDRRDFAAVARDARVEILERLFPKQLDRVMEVLPSCDLAPDVCRGAMVALLAAMRRYRTYGDDVGLSGGDRAALEEAKQVAGAALEPSQCGALDHICATLASGAAPTFRTRFQQLSATLAAKAVEDTAFYRYGRLLSRNEVGSDPGRLAISPEAFHAYCKRRRSDFPTAMLATATHDHKRGEDSRARLAVLSEIPEAWRTFATPFLNGSNAVAPAIRYTILQGIVGAWPLAFDPDDPDERQQFQERLDRWLIKALREAKQATSWAAPDEAFEQGCLDFMHRVLERDRAAIAAFVARIAPSGILNALSQTLLRLTTPGVPDLYRGAALWDFSLVDPDNRAPVDFAALRADLGAVEPLDALLPHWRDGRIKQALIARLLSFRQRKPGLFAKGSYEPLAITGRHARHLIGFARRAGEDTLIVLALRLSATARGAADPDTSPNGFWEGTQVALPGDGAASDLLGVRNITLKRTACAAQLLGPLPLAALHLANA